MASESSQLGMYDLDSWDDMSRTSTKMSVSCKGNVLVYYPPFHLLMFYLLTRWAQQSRRGSPRGSVMTYTRPPTGFLAAGPEVRIVILFTGYGPLRPRLGPSPCAIGRNLSAFANMVSSQRPDCHILRFDDLVPPSAREATPAPRKPSRLTCMSRPFPVHPDMRHMRSRPLLAHPLPAMNECKPRDHSHVSTCISPRAFPSRDRLVSETTPPSCFW